MNIRDIRDDKGMLVGRMYSELFGCEIDVLLGGSEIEYAEKCAEYFNHMPADLVNELKKYTLRYCEDFRQFFDEESPEVPPSVNESEIFDYVHPHVLIIRAPKDSDKIIAFGLEFGCCWEPEHGMEWAVRDGRALYVGDFTNIGPWRDEKYYKRAGLNYVFNEHCMG